MNLFFLFASQRGKPDLSKFQQKFALPANKFLRRIQIAKVPLFDEIVVKALKSTVDFLIASNFQSFLGYDLNDETVVEIMSMPLNSIEIVTMGKVGSFGVVWSHDEEKLLVTSCQLVKLNQPQDICVPENRVIASGEFHEKGQLIAVFPHVMHPELEQFGVSSEILFPLVL